jgi:DNA-binding PadR family transcriptional regulator
MKTRDVVLGLIALHPGVSGYQLRQIIERSTSFFFSISLSSIYPILRSLADEGLVTFQVEELVGKQDRKTYTLTPEGEAHLTAALRERPSAEFSLAAFQDTLLHLALMANLSNDDIRAFLEDALRNLRADRTRVRQEGVAVVHEYMTLGGRARSRYLSLWTRENHYLAADLDLKIGWIEGFIDSLETDLGP